jgi:hypothetical protein
MATNYTQRKTALDEIASNITVAMKGIDKAIENQKLDADKLVADFVAQSIRADSLINAVSGI